MNAYLDASIAVALAYLIGSIPFAYLAVYLVKGIDVRTVGSGNAGATNAARVLGAWTFFPIFLLDLIKGLLPTIFFPRAVTALSGVVLPDLPVLVALATILGHNFPIYLKFKGGKGVATSLGAVAALDPLASGATVATALVVFLVTKMVSVASALGATIFVVVHFGYDPAPFARKYVALDVLTILLWGMLLVRHRKNFARVVAGTEPRVQLRRKKTPPGGRIRLILVAGLALVTIAAGSLAWASRTSFLDCGDFTLVASTRASTGHQRAERLAFAGEGTRLAVTCPRYNRVVVYKIGADRSMTVAGDVDVAGRAVAIWPRLDRFLVLIRPYGDARHVEAGWLQAIDLDGKLVGSKTRVGFDPDDLVATPDGRAAFIVNSGHAEGETNRPDPELICLDLSDVETPRIVGRVAFDQAGDDPARLALSISSRKIAISLPTRKQLAIVDVSHPDHPRLVSRMAMPASRMALDAIDGDAWPLSPGSTDRDAALIATGNSNRPGEKILVETLPESSGIEVFRIESRQSLGRLAIRGAGNLGTIRPEGIAYSSDRGLLAIANRSGGSVHLVEIRPKPTAGSLAGDPGRNRRPR